MSNKSHHFFADREFEFTALLLIGTTYYRGADVGELLRTFRQVRNGHREDWDEAFVSLAKRIHAIAVEAEKTGHRQSAADAYSRAATYYIAACRFLNSPAKRTNAFELWKNHRQCWEDATRLLPVPGVKIRIPYEGNPPTN